MSESRCPKCARDVFTAGADACDHCAKHYEEAMLAAAYAYRNRRAAEVSVDAAASGTAAPLAPAPQPGGPVLTPEPHHDNEALEPAIDFDSSHAAPVPAATSTLPSSSLSGRFAPAVSRVQMAAIAATVIAGVVVIFTVLSTRGSASPDTAAPRATTVERTGRGSVRPRASAPPRDTAPQWNRATDGRWADGNRKSVAFELPAVNKVQVWTRSVRPVLVLRCNRGIADVFVYTQSAARMEPQDEDHTVRLKFDDASETTERWPDSVDHDALFAPDGPGFAAKLASAHTLRFGFNPHNAEPASAMFEVSGLADLLAGERSCASKR